MIQKAAMQEEEEQLSPGSRRSSVDLSSDMDSLSFTQGSSAMSSVFGTTGPSSSDGGSTKPARSSSSRNSSPSGRSGRRRSLSNGGGFFHRRSSSQLSSWSGADPLSPRSKRDDHLSRWLTGGNVIYKSVGLSLLDLVVGMEIVRLAREHNVGSYIENFS
jgi:hypothetical protein